MWIPRSLIGMLLIIVVSSCSGPERTFQSPAGKSYNIVQTKYEDSYEEVAPSTEASVLPIHGDDHYKGTARRAAKTSISDAEVERFARLDLLLEDLPSDSKMRDRNPRISKNANSERVAEEDRNVKVDSCLYAASKEEDNDYHLIIGTCPGEGRRQYMNIEISGLPNGGADLSRLRAVRDHFAEYFGDDLPGRGYDKYNPPISVQVTGSLFYDISHGPGAVGPRGRRPRTAWEIHPVTFIVFEP